MRFTGRVVLITGAAVGIGRGLVAAFAGEGATVVLNDIDPDAAKRAASEVTLELAGTTGAGAVLPAVADVADVDAVRAMVRGVVDGHGRLDIVVANAGITSFGPFLEAEPEAVDRLMAVNLRGTFFTAQAAASTMVASGRAGRIILMSSVAGVQAIRGLSAYGMSKAGLRMLARALALELGPHGITVNAVGPGATLTERTSVERPDYQRDWAAVAPDGRTGSIADVAAAVMYLASDQAAHVTGHTLMVDGGWTTTSAVPEGY